MIEIYATYNGERFPVKIGEEYEFSFNGKIWKKGTFKFISRSYNGVICYIIDTKPLEEAYLLIRPIQPKEVKPLTADELYRICGKNGYEVKATNGDESLYGIILGIDSEPYQTVTLCTYNVNLEDVIYYRKAYSQDEWKPIAEIER